LPEGDVLRILADGELRPLGLMPRASNATLLCELVSGDVRTLAVYKPRRGEEPLWDFPPGTLCLREQAAYLVSRATGWDLVPPTVLRDGPYGYGAVQLFIDAEPGEHYLTLAERYSEVFRRMCAFDVVINNADRKSGHCLLERGGDRIWVVDHGVTFHPDPKLRTVVWDFVGEPLGDDVVDGLEALLAVARNGSEATFGGLLSEDETSALARRTARLLKDRVFPEPVSSRPYPWPPV
jgi:uncharacterized repeat protein (TIGR03843 family)